MPPKKVPQASGGASDDKSKEKKGGTSVKARSYINLFY